MAEANAHRTYAGRSADDRRAQRRERIMEAGLELIGTEGYAATSIERLCQQAGVSTRNFYEEFSSREALLLALHDRIAEEAFAGVRAALDRLGDADLRQRIAGAVHGYVQATASDPRRARLSFVEVMGVSDAVEQHRMDWRTRWTDVLMDEARRAANRGEAIGRDFRLGSVALIGAVNELAQHWTTNGHNGSLDELVAEIVRLATAMLTTP